jgi:hypothetical protein
MIAVTPASFAESRLWAFAPEPRVFSVDHEDRCSVTASPTGSAR